MSTSSQSSRDRLMAALSAAEQLAAQSPADPYTVSTAQRVEWGFVPGTWESVVGVELHFNAADDVRAFGEATKTPVAVEPVQTSDGRQAVDTLAQGKLGGVPFRAWARSAATSSAVAA